MKESVSRMSSESRLRAPDVTSCRANPSSKFKLFADSLPKHRYKGCHTDKYRGIDVSVIGDPSNFTDAYQLRIARFGLIASEAARGTRCSTGRNVDTVEE